MSNFREQIYNLISEQLGVEKKEITPHSHFADDLNAGDLELAELVATIEDRFKIKLDREQISKINTVDDLVHLVFDKLDGLLDEE